MPLYYIHTARMKNEKCEIENFDENFLYHIKGLRKK